MSQYLDREDKTHSVLCQTPSEIIAALFVLASDLIIKLDLCLKTVLTASLNAFQLCG